MKYRGMKPREACQEALDEILKYEPKAYLGLVCFNDQTGEHGAAAIGDFKDFFSYTIRDDTMTDVEYIARKLLNIRLFDDSAGKRWQRSVRDENLELLCVSQFTLYNRLKGNKPDFHLAMQGQDASNLYNCLLKKLGEQYSEDKIKNGLFGAMMQVHIQNDGPVTIEIESPGNVKTSNVDES